MWGLSIDVIYNVFNKIALFYSAYAPYINMALGLLCVCIALLTVSKIISSIKVREVVTRSAEIKVKRFFTVIVLTVYAAYVLSLFFPVMIYLTISLLLLFASYILYLLRDDLINTFSYISIITSGTLREGERVIIRMGGESYEGVVTEVNEKYVVLRTGHNALVYIPNFAILRSVVVRPSLTTLRLRIMLKSVEGSIDVNTLIRSVEEIVRSSKLVNKASVQVRLLEVQEDRVSLLIEADVVNPRNVDEAYAEIINSLKSGIPHRIRVEIEQE